MDDGDHIDALPELAREINADYLNLDITDEEICKSLKDLKSNTAAGYDGLCIEMFKVTAERIVPFLTKTFSIIYLKRVYFQKTGVAVLLLPFTKKINLRAEQL
ncbi:hypothetical protein DPMN_175252 [Dreissena polymorpha]|uniref:Uncharacterized protein n=1 Tax=Dreissena polymorpha TaxID=45954 RepID=A0A9D4E646_DREPO|nr:hypothetical protein DPMN_175252 [Dreissena polymorpha]